MRWEKETKDRREKKRKKEIVMTDGENSLK